MLTTKPSDLRTAYKNQIDFDHRHEKQVNFDACTNTSDFRPAYKNQINFNHPHKTKSIDPHTRNKQFSARTQKHSQVRSIDYI